MTMATTTAAIMARSIVVYSGNSEGGGALVTWIVVSLVDHS